MIAPFPYFGGKREIASAIWSRLGSPRQVAMWVARQLGGTWPKLGLAFERDPQVVRFGCQRVEHNPELLTAGREILARVPVAQARLLAMLEGRAAA